MINTAEAFEAAVLADTYAYCKFETWRLSGRIDTPDDITCRVYAKDDKSPTGRRLAAILHDWELARDILLKHNRL